MIALHRRSRPNMVCSRPIGAFRYRLVRSFVFRGTSAATSGACGSSPEAVTAPLELTMRSSCAPLSNDVLHAALLRSLKLILEMIELVRETSCRHFQRSSLSSL